MPNINIKATNTTITPAINDYVAKHIKTLVKFLREENDVHVELEVDPKHQSGPKFRAEITVLPRPGAYAEARGEDLYEAVDLCIPKIKEQLMKRKDKRVSQRRKLGAGRKNDLLE